MEENKGSLNANTPLQESLALCAQESEGQKQRLGELEGSENKNHNKPLKNTKTGAKQIIGEKRHRLKSRVTLR